MAIALVILVGDLLAELAAHTLVLLGTLHTAGTVSARTLKSLLDCSDYFLILVLSYLHKFSSISSLSFSFGT